MRKTLLMAAAALAAGVISSQAQTPVYSQNVVGYVNQVIPANHLQMIGSQMINGSDVGQTNGDVNATLVSGVYSASIPQNANPASVGTNTEMLYWNGSGYVLYYYFNTADASTWQGDSPGTDPGGWYDANQNIQTALYLNNGKSAFLYNRAGVPLTLTTVGTVLQGTNVVTTINSGFQMINLPQPVSTNIDNPVFGLPVASLHSSNPGLNATPTSASNDEILFWTGTGFAQFYYFTSNDASAWMGDPPGTDAASFYDANQNTMASDGYQPLVNQGFFFWHTGSSFTWTNTFNVQ